MRWLLLKTHENVPDYRIHSEPRWNQLDDAYRGRYQILEVFDHWSPARDRLDELLASCGLFGVPLKPGEKRLFPYQRVVHFGDWQQHVKRPAPQSAVARRDNGCGTVAAAVVDSPAPSKPR